MYISRSERSRVARSELNVLPIGMIVALSDVKPRSEVEHDHRWCRPGAGMTVERGDRLVMAGVGRAKCPDHRVPRSVITYVADTVATSPRCTGPGFVARCPRSAFIAATLWHAHEGLEPYQATACFHAVATTGLLFRFNPKATESPAGSYSRAIGRPHRSLADERLRGRGTDHVNGTHCPVRVAIAKAV